MKLINTLQAVALAATLGSPLNMSAQKMKAPIGGKEISKDLIGIFFEDISYSADGGLYAELVQNGSFEYNPTERDGWGAGTAWRFMRPGHSLGYITPMMANPIHENNPTYMRLHIERVGHYYDFNGWTGVGMRNDGFDGIAVKAGAKYDFSVFLRNVDAKNKDMRIVLVGEKDAVLGEATITADSKDWKKYTAEITSNADCEHANLQVLCLTTGDVDVDMVSLMPQDTYNGHGLRKDMVEALKGLEPKFMRFPEDVSSMEAAMASGTLIVGKPLLVRRNSVVG